MGRSVRRDICMAEFCQYITNLHTYRHIRTFIYIYIFLFNWRDRLRERKSERERKNNFPSGSFMNTLKWFLWEGYTTVRVRPVAEIDELYKTHTHTLIKESSIALR